MMKQLLLPVRRFPNPVMCSAPFPYMSPEQLEGKEVTPASDIFSLGIILYEMATGVNPFRKASQAATISAILTFQPPLIETSRAEINFEFSKIVKKCLQKDPTDRFTNADELFAAINSFKQGITSIQLKSTAKNRIC